jgi:hypothetical protein
MQNADLLAERERRAVRKRADAIRRAMATIELALSDLPEIDRTLVLLTKLKEDNQTHRERSRRASLA